MLLEHVLKHQEKPKEPTDDETEVSKHVECPAKSTRNVVIVLDGEQCLFIQHHNSMPVKMKRTCGFIA
jgi:hypothetical protein